jgi:dTDP-4-amino-4,6-dideoxygalactose transaminase
LPVNLHSYLARRLDVQDKWRQALLSSRDVVDLPLMHNVPSDYGLLRYSVLVTSRVRRDEIYVQLRQAGLGASIMYAEVLPDIEGVGPLVTVPGPIPCARDFAGRLLTLPTHEDVDDATIQRTATLLSH